MSIRKSREDCTNSCKHGSMLVLKWVGLDAHCFDTADYGPYDYNKVGAPHNLLLAELRLAKKVERCEMRGCFFFLMSLIYGVVAVRGAS